MIKVLSFNVLCYGSDEHTWTSRAPLVIKVIKDVCPDSFGVQEAHKEWMDVLCAGLPEYAFVGVGREDGKDEGEFSAVFYKKDKFDVVDSGTFWLSETPETPSKGWDGVCYRVCSFAQLKDKESGETYVHMNTHLDHRGIVARKEGVKLIRAKAASFGGLPVVCTGDFNIEQDTDCYIDMVSENMRDARKFAPDTDDSFTFHAFKPETTQGFIDFVFFDEATIKPLRFNVENYKVDGQFYSDHYAVSAELEIIK